MKRAVTMLAAVAMAFVLFNVQATAADEKPGEWVGPVEKTQHNVPRLSVEGKKFRLKASAKATDAVKETLKKIGEGELKGKYKVTGTTEKEGEQTWILVDTIEKVKEGEGEKKEGEKKKEGEQK